MEKKLKVIWEIYGMTRKIKKEKDSSIEEIDGIYDGHNHE